MTMKAPSPPTNEQAGLARPNANPTSKPKRPLSAYNLFYRFKRQKIVEAVAAATGAPMDKDAICGVIAASPGLEGIPKSATDVAPPDLVRALRRRRILKDLEGNTDPRDTRARSHRKNENALNGALTFVELGKVMNAGWKGCDPFAKSVFEELSLAGRERYRQRIAEYNAHSKGQGLCEEEPTEAKATPAPTPANKKDPARRRLPMKKYIAVKVKSSPSPSLIACDASTSDNARAMNETAEAMVQLAAGLIPSKAKDVPPTDGNQTESPSTVNKNCADAPSLPCLSSTGEAIRNGAAPMPGEIARAANVTPGEIARAANVTPPDTPTPPCAPPYDDAEELLRLRVERLEAQLTKERLRTRIQELEAERSQHLLVREARVRELEAERSRRLLREELLTRNRAAAVAPPALSGDSFLLDDALPGFSGPRPSSVELMMSERAAVLSRIADLRSLRTLPGVPFKRPSPMMPGMAFPGSLGFDGRPVKRQRLDSLFAAMRD